MEAINQWWGTLSGVNQGFYTAAIFFGIIFLWQMILAVMGIGHGEAALDTHVEATGVHEGAGDAQETVAAFKLLSVRSILAFFTLFTWGGALYLQRGVPMGRTVLYSAGWGLAAMALVAFTIKMLRGLAETGNQRIETCVGTAGTVHLDIPANGLGEIRATCSGVITHVKARAAGGQTLKAGTPVRIVKMLEGNVVEVEAAGGAESVQKGKQP